MKNSDQVKIALGFLCDFVTAAKVDPAKIVVIAPYKANVEFINGLLLKKPQYAALKAMRLAATVDSFQGQEGEIAAVVLGTTQHSGPGFTTDPNRLNFLFSRHKSGLLIFGDINVTGRLEDEKGMM